MQPDELPAFFTALDSSPNEIVRDYIRVSLFTGARRANVMSMKWADINITTRRWAIQETKNGDPIVIPLHDRVIEILNKRKEDNKKLPYDNTNYVFPGTGKSGHLVEPKKAWKSIKIHASILIWKHDEKLKSIIEDIEHTANNYTGYDYIYKRLLEETARQNIILNPAVMDVRLHDLRRTLGSWQAASGTSTAIIGKSLGHKTHQATAIYARLNLDPVKQAMTVAGDNMLDKAYNKQDK